MSEQRPPRPSKHELPDVINTMRNFSNFLGEGSPLPRDLRLARGGYRVGGTGLAEAHGIIELGTDSGIGFIVGHFNPASQEWQIFPECVPNKMQAKALSIEMQYKLPRARREAMAEGRRPGGGFVDMHAPATHEARSRLEQQIAPLQPMEFAQEELVREALSHGDLLHGREGSPVVGTDANTFCYPTLAIQTVEHTRVEQVNIHDAITTSEIELRPDALLTLCYTGLVVQSQNRQGRMRAIRHVPVAHGDPDLGWIANVDVVTPDQWDILRPVASTLIKMSRDIPRFSPQYSSVVYGQPGPETLQWGP